MSVLAGAATHVPHPRTSRLGPCVCVCVCVPWMTIQELQGRRATQHHHVHHQQVERMCAMAGFPPREEFNPAAVGMPPLRYASHDR